MAKADDCFACGAAVPDDAVTCPSCAYPVGVAFDSQPSFERSAEPVGPRSGMKAAAVVLAVAAVAAGTFLFLNRDDGVDVAGSSSDSTTSAAPLATTTTPTSDTPATTSATTATSPTTTDPTSTTVAVAEPLPALDRDSARSWLDSVVVVEAVGCGSGAITSGLVVGDQLVMTAGEIAAHPWVLRVYGGSGEVLAANEGAAEDLINGRTSVGDMTLLSIDVSVPVPDIAAVQPLLAAGDELVIVGWPDLTSLDEPAQLIDAVVGEINGVQTDLIVELPLGRSVIGSPVIGGDGQLVGLVKSITNDGVRVTFPWSSGLESNSATCEAARPWITADQADVFRDPEQRAALTAQAVATSAAAFTGFDGPVVMVPLVCVDCDDDVIVWRFGRHTFEPRQDFVDGAAGEVPLDAELFSAAVQSVNRLACLTWQVNDDATIAPDDAEALPPQPNDVSIEERAQWARADEVRPDDAIETTELVDDLLELCVEPV